ncbi:MAG: hypothetical protein AAF702_00670 [Chloroflexota bacterium]
MLNTAPTSYSQEMQIESIQKNIHDIVEQLPLESLRIIQQFALFLQQKEPQELLFEKPPTPMKIVTVPASQVMKLAGALPTGYEGNALLDSEAYFDDV